MTVNEAFAMLPEEPKAIAKFLLAEGCKGVRKSGSKCPVVRWLGKNGIRIGEISAYGVLLNNDRQGPDYKLPRHVFLFVLQFDDGLFPELVE